MGIGLITTIERPLARKRTCVSWRRSLQAPSRHWRCRLTTGMLDQSASAHGIGLLARVTCAPRVCRAIGAKSRLSLLLRARGRLTNHGDERLVVRRAQLPAGLGSQGG